jgi:hypothetical protein
MTWAEYLLIILANEEPPSRIETAEDFSKAWAEVFGS